MSLNPGEMCPLCHEAISRGVQPVKGGTIHIGICKSCMLGLTLPKASVTNPEYSGAPKYAQSYASQEEKFRSYFRTFMAWIGNFISQGRLLDVGCSTGLLVDQASQMGFEAEGIDLDVNAIDCGRRDGRRVKLGALEKAAEPSYDILTLSHTLEHVPEPLCFLEVCAGHLNTGGYLAVAVPCFAGLYPRIYGAKWYGWLPDQHYFHYSAKALGRLFSRTGLQPVGFQQNSMDHRPPIGNMRRSKIPQALISWGVAGFSGLIGKGDQLYALARKL